MRQPVSSGCIVILTALFEVLSRLPISLAGISPKWRCVLLKTLSLLTFQDLVVTKD